MTNIWALLAAAVGGGGLAGVVGTLITGVMGRPKTRADAVALLTDSALKQVNELQERTAEAEREALAARQQMRELTGEIDAAVATLRTWRSAILSTPGVPESLLVMVRNPGGAINGRHL
ncbi:hypothetical protein [Micromonospora rubida]|uniref:hypothetical protein n=1 Tax=Micromonospora rubida TaxID=2697657 RepID=UPI0013773FC7|nr:hypothetical protein [Micromonospora rubida]NBE80299.1 hypothetical protein [Micromonospora rubida]